MDQETLWILKKLSAKEISSESARRILHALELLNRVEQRKAAESSSETSEAEEKTTSASTTEKDQKAAPADALSPVESAETSTEDKSEEPAEEESAKEIVAEVEDKQEITAVQEENISGERSESAEVPKAEQVISDSESESAVGDIEQTTAEISENAPISEEKAVISEEITEAVADSLSQPIAAEEEPESKTEDTLSDTPASIEESISGSVSDEGTTSRKPVTRKEGKSVIQDIQDSMELLLEKPAGDIIIQGWNENYIMAEGEENLSSTLQSGKILRIDSIGDVILYIPTNIGRIIVKGGSGSVDIEKYLNDVFIEDNSGDINIKEVGGNIEAISLDGNITLEECYGKASLKSGAGDITVRKVEGLRMRRAAVEENTAAITESETPDAHEFGSDVVFAYLGGDINVRSSGGNVLIEECSGRSVSVKCTGGSLKLRNVNNNMELDVENGDIDIDSFSGNLKLETKDSEISLRHSGDAEIHIQSDGGDIDISDCYADVYVNSGSGNVSLSGGNLSFGGMGRIDLKLGSGNAYLSRRTFEDINISIENGNAELNMEKLGSSGSGRVSVYNGDIITRVKPDFRCELNAHAPRKRIHIDLPVDVVVKDKNRIWGTLNGGGSKIELIAPNGDITFQALEMPLHRLSGTKKDLVNASSS